MAEAAFKGGGPRDVRAAICDLQLLVRETLNAGNPAGAAADGLHHQLREERACEAQAVLADLARLEGTDSKAECQRILDSVEAFVTRWNRRLGR